MGIIDKITYSLHCDNCETTEKASITDNGSNWGGPHWQSEASFTKFSTSWNGGGKMEPKLIEAKCKNCGQPVRSESKYGGF